MSLYETRYEQAMSGLGDTGDTAGGVVMIRDGHTTWLCAEEAFDAAADEMRRLSPLSGDDDSSEAYTELCSLIGRRSAVASVDAGSRHGTSAAQAELIQRALRAGLIDCEMVLAMGARLDKHADPVEGAREGLAPREAESIARQDASLIHVVEAWPIHCARTGLPIWPLAPGWHVRGDSSIDGGGLCVVRESDRSAWTEQSPGYGTETPVIPAEHPARQYSTETTALTREAQRQEGAVLAQILRDGRAS